MLFLKDFFLIMTKSYHSWKSLCGVLFILAAFVCYFLLGLFLFWFGFVKHWSRMLSLFQVFRQALTQIKYHLSVSQLQFWLDQIWSVHPPKSKGGMDEKMSTPWNADLAESRHVFICNHQIVNSGQFSNILLILIWNQIPTVWGSFFMQRVLISITPLSTWK